MKTLLKFMFVCIVSIQMTAQERLISGKVTSANDNIPLAGANVLIKGTNIGTSTNFDGLYQIKVKASDVLIFNYVGFKTEERKVGTLNTISVALQEDGSHLDEVVVMGYGTTTKRSYTASVSQIKRQKQKAYHNKLANQVQSKSVVNALQGKVAGIQINPVPSAPNTQIFIRGNASVSKGKEAIVIVDGVLVSNKKLEQINPNQIKNISVLKGANATSLYGNKGANGVLIISTKNGKTKEAEQPLYIVDGMPIKKENNHIVENLPKQNIDSKKKYNKSEAKKKFGKIAKNGCIVITTHQGNFRINNDESYAIIEENSFERTSLSPLSTFSIDVDKASYSNIRRMINNGMTIEPDAVKIEEMVNYFDYNYPQPTGEHPFSIHSEASKTPWNNETKIVKIGLQGKTFLNEELPASNLTFLIDVSGSMSSQNKLPLLKSAFKLLVNQLRAQDKVSIVVYAGAAGVVLEPTSGNKKEKILAALDNLNSGGSTAGGAGIK